MTNADKFKEVFKIDRNQITNEWWSERYNQLCPDNCYECEYNCDTPSVSCKYCEQLRECLDKELAVEEKYNGNILIHKKYVGLCPMQIERKEMIKVDEWETSPQPVKKYIHNPRYAVAYCQCPVPFDIAIVIDKWKTNKVGGFYNFHCTKCDLHGQIYA